MTWKEDPTITTYWRRLGPKWNHDNVQHLKMVRMRCGFCTALIHVLRVVPNGYINFGPPCASFVFLNVGTSKRSTTSPYGNEGLPYIKKANENLDWCGEPCGCWGLVQIIHTWVCLYHIDIWYVEVVHKLRIIQIWGDSGSIGPWKVDNQKDIIMEYA